MPKAQILFDRVHQKLKDHYGVDQDRIDLVNAAHPDSFVREIAKRGIDEADTILAIRRRQYLDGGFVRREVYQISRRPGHYRPALTRKIAKEVPLARNRKAGRKPDDIRQIIYIAALFLVNSARPGLCRQERYACAAEMLGFGRDASDRIEKYCGGSAYRSWNTALRVGVDCAISDLPNADVVAIASIAEGKPPTKAEQSIVDTAVTFAQLNRLKLIQTAMDFITVEQSLIAAEIYKGAHMPPLGNSAIWSVVDDV